MNKKGFTLIELLAVIIILGILMIIAIPSVTKYISDSRKNAYVDTAKQLIGSARNIVNSGEFEMYDTNTTYYIDVACIKSENATKSPYGDFVQGGAYVVVTYDGKGYTYYWTSVDDAGQGIKDIIRFDKLDTDDISSDLSPSDITTTRGIDGRGYTVLIRMNSATGSCTKDGANPATSQVSGENGGGNGNTSSGPVVYPIGKNKNTVVTGDIVTIDTEQFYVVKHDGNDLILLSRYNLNVGNYKKPGIAEGIQDSEIKGYFFGAENIYGPAAFSSTNYWNGKVGTDYPGSICQHNGINCAYVYDSNSYLKTYVDNYKTYLEGKGATIKSARVLRVEEAFELGCESSNLSCNNAPAWVHETSYWLGSPYTSGYIWIIFQDGRFSSYDCTKQTSFGVRPVIVI